MSLKSKLKKAGALSDFMCDTCGNAICECILDRIRNQENALIVAKQALESIETLNTKLTMDIEDLRKENAELKDKVQGKFWKDVRGKQEQIDRQVQRFRARNSMIQ